MVDMGTGANVAASELLAKGIRNFDIFSTHLHIDHINGIFGFPPIYRKDCKVHFYSDKPEIEAVFSMLLREPLHPVPYNQLSPIFEYTILEECGSIFLEKYGLTVSWAPQNHPQRSLAYRFDDGENAIVFATDVELYSWDIPDSYINLFTDPYPAQISCIDGFFTPEEIDNFRNWGHSSWQEGRDFLDKCGCGQLLVIHHHPQSTDEQMDSMSATLHNVSWAREGEIWQLGGMV